jgi:hypothetical protein
MRPPTKAWSLLKDSGSNDTSLTPSSQRPIPKKLDHGVADSLEIKLHYFVIFSKKYENLKKTQACHPISLPRSESLIFLGF